jgi:hypothetical protein
MVEPSVPPLDDQRARSRQLEVLSLLASKQQPCGSTAISGVQLRLNGKLA